MMYERFTDRARKVMQLANQEAQRVGRDYVGTEDVLLALLKEGSGVAAWVLKNLGLTLEKLRDEAQKIVKPHDEVVSIGRLPLVPRVKKAIEHAMLEASNLNHNYVGTEHLLLGLIVDQESVAYHLLMNLGVHPDMIRDEVKSLLGIGNQPAELPDAQPATTGFTINVSIPERGQKWKFCPHCGEELK